jgi:hypothetical protein
MTAILGASCGFGMVDFVMVWLLDVNSGDILLSCDAPFHVDEQLN